MHGLEGANAGEHLAYPEHCTTGSRNCIVYAKLTGSELEFFTGYWGYLYAGTGMLKDGRLKLETIHSYRGLEIQYDLEGFKESE